MVLEENPVCLRRDGVVCLPPGGTNAPQFTHRQRFLLGVDRRTHHVERSLSGEIIHHKNAPLFESSEKINPRGVIRLKGIKGSFLFFLDTRLCLWMVFSSN